MQGAGHVQGGGEQMGENGTTILAYSIKYISFFKRKKKDYSWYLLDGPAPGGDSINSSVSWDEDSAGRSLKLGREIWSLSCCT